MALGIIIFKVVAVPRGDISQILDKRSGTITNRHGKTKYTNFRLLFLLIRLTASPVDQSIFATEVERRREKFHP